MQVPLRGRVVDVADAQDVHGAVQVAGLVLTLLVLPLGSQRVVLPVGEGGVRHWEVSWERSRSPSGTLPSRLPVEPRERSLLLKLRSHPHSINLINKFTHI